MKKFALIQLPPETPQIWEWVKTRYAQRVLNNFKNPFISEKKAREIISQYQKIISIPTPHLKTSQDEINFVLTNKLNNITAYDIDKSGTYSSHIIPIQMAENKNLPAGSKTWGLLSKKLSLPEMMYELHDLLKYYINKLNNCPNDQELVEKTLLRRKAEKDSKNKPAQLNVSKEFYLNVPKWNIYGLTDPIYIEIQLQEKQTELYGEWIENKNSLILYVLPHETNPQDLVEYSMIQLKLKTTLKHELRHLIQTLITRSKKTPAGLPKYKTPGYDPYGLSQTEHLTHPLRDIEFHPSLGEAIDEYKDIRRYFPKSKWQEVIKTFIGLNPKYKINNSIVISDGFFKALKANYPKKWRQAVKLFLKEVL